MRTMLASSALILAGACATPPDPAEVRTPPLPGFDAELADELGADEYGMRRYVVAFLEAGPNRDHDAAEAQRLQKEHLANIKRLADAGKLAVAGPFLDDGELRGIYIFSVETIEEARQLTADDPAVKAGRLVMDLHPWYGSAALVQVNEVHRRLVANGN